MEDFTEKIHKIAAEFLTKTTSDGQVSVSPQGDDVWAVDVTVGDPAALIGWRGENLLAFQHLLRIIVVHALGQPLRLVVDINNYRKKRIASLRELARTAAGRVRLSRQAVALGPMTAFDRRIIHLELAGRPDVITESMGSEPERSVVVKPYP